MAFTLLTLQTTTRQGITPTYGACASGGNSFDNASQAVILHVKNTDSSIHTLTIDSTKTIDGRVLPTLQIQVPITTGEKIIGPFPNELYGEVDTDNGIAKAVKITFDAVTGMTIAAIKVGVLSY